MQLSVIDRSNLTPNRNNLSLKRKKGISILSEHRNNPHNLSQPNLKYISLTSRGKYEESNKRDIRLIVRKKDEGLDQGVSGKKEERVNEAIARKICFEESTNKKSGLKTTLKYLHPQKETSKQLIKLSSRSKLLKWGHC